MNKIFGNKLKQLREAKKLTQLQLARIAGVSKTTISQWETQKQEPRVKYIIIFAIYFKVSSDYLLGERDEFGNKINDDKNYKLK